MKPRKWEAPMDKYCETQQQVPPTLPAHTTWASRPQFPFIGFLGRVHKNYMEGLEPHQIVF